MPKIIESEWRVDLRSFESCQGGLVNRGPVVIRITAAWKQEGPLPLYRPALENLNRGLCTTNNEFLLRPRRFWLSGLGNQLIEGRVLGSQDGGDGFATVGCHMVTVSTGDFSDEPVGSQQA